MNYFTILIRLAIVLSVFILPWWIVVVLAVGALIIFDSFFEIILIGLLIDVSYGSHVVFESFPYVATLVATLVFVVVERFRSNLRM